ncbi:DUF300 domain-containing protein [Myxozyma melibiosi]|uniref:DUF300 domain-containing protein n=1 Tax=Myxozyma melibiosi TaxID=54550 RepID=A0ABR1F3Y5_9ASCO
MSGTVAESHLPNWLIATTGLFAFSAALTSSFSMYMHAKNYRKPLLQRFVVRIQLLIPIYALTCWFSLVSHRLAMFFDPIRDIYEAFVIYQFLWLLTNFLGGERNVIVMMSGQPPREHLFPPFRRIFPKIDVSDPHDFLAIKRGVLQYAWLKPVFSLLIFLMKAIGIYQEGYISWSSGYFWLGILYNISVSLSLYCLALFWMCLSQPLQPFRPVPKFLCIKLILFASYWQGVTLSVLVLLGVIRDVGYYTPNNVARVVQNSLMCVEMLFFAIGHWHAFSWKDYEDNSIGSARLPIYYAFRDAFGMLDIVEDFKDTLRGDQYQYRFFDSAGAIEHPDSTARLARLREGLRYQHGGAAKYWLPKPSALQRKSFFGELISGFTDFASSSRGAIVLPLDEDHLGDLNDPNADEAWKLDKETEDLFKLAKSMEFGDYNYPVLTVNESLSYTPLSKKVLASRIEDYPTQYSWSRSRAESSSSAGRDSIVQPPRPRQASEPIIHSNQYHQSSQALIDLDSSEPTFPRSSNGKKPAYIMSLDSPSAPGPSMG